MDANDNINLEPYRQRGWQAGLRCYPDCRHHYLEPYRSAYGEAYDQAVAYRAREGIDFYAAKARTIIR